MAVFEAFLDPAVNYWAIFRGSPWDRKESKAMHKNDASRRTFLEVFDFDGPHIEWTIWYLAVMGWGTKQASSIGEPPITARSISLDAGAALFSTNI